MNERTITKLNFTEDTKIRDIGEIWFLEVNANGDPFLRFYDNTLAIRTKLNKTAWKILKDNNNKRKSKHQNVSKRVGRVILWNK